MATFVFTNNTYAGKEVAGFMASTLLEADSVKRGLLTVFPNCKSRQVILDVDDDVVLQNPSANFVDQGTTASQTESYLDPVTYEFMKEQEWEALIQSWESQNLKAGSLEDYDGDIDLADFLVERYMAKIQIANERLYWVGKGNVDGATFSAPYVGLLAKIAASGSTYKVSLGTIAGSSFAATAIDASGNVTVTSTTNLSNGDVVTITAVTGSSADAIYGAISGQSYKITVTDATHFKLVMNYNEVGLKRRAAAFTGTATAATISFINASNVLAVLGAVYAQIDEADRQQDDFNIMVPYHIGRAYAIAQANKATNVLNAFTDKKVMDYLGDHLQIMEHFNANVVLCARASNLFLGVDLLSDKSRLMTVNTAPYTANMVVRMRARMKSDVNAKFFNEILYVSA